MNRLPPAETTTMPALLRAAATASIATAILLGGCNNANTTQSGSGRANAGFGSNVPYERIVLNSWLNYKANVVGVREGTVSDNIKKIAVDVYSDQANMKRFSYRFEWFDGVGMPIADPSSGLTSVTIHPKETITLTSVAPTPTASQWRLTFLDQN